MKTHYMVTIPRWMVNKGNYERKLSYMERFQVLKKYCHSILSYFLLVNHNETYDKINELLNPVFPISGAYSPCTIFHQWDALPTFPSVERTPHPGNFNILGAIGKFHSSSGDCKMVDIPHKIIVICKKCALIDNKMKKKQIINFATLNVSV